MTFDDERPRPPPQVTVGEALASLSVGELEARIVALEAEIARTRHEIDRKKSHESAAAALFRR